MNTYPQNPRYKQALLIDDDEVDNYITQRVLKSVFFAENIEIKLSGIEALSYVKELIAEVKKLPEVIFLDITMPEMDGFKFLDSLKKLGEQVKIDSKIIVLTNSVYADTPRIKNAGSNPMIHSVLLKPLSVEALQKISA